MFRLLLGFVFVYLLLTQSAQALGPNDISILLPLPRLNEQSMLLGTKAAGAEGELLPKQVFDRLPSLVEPFPAPDAIYQLYLKIIAIRLDPCFSEGNGTPCRKQLRLIWQPVLTSGGSSTTADAAVHTFYEFDDAKWSQLMMAWGELVTGQEQDVLQVHPRLKAEGYAGPYWKKLRAVLLRFCGARTLVRSTAMALNGGIFWTFIGVDWVNGQAKTIPIPRIGRNAQAFLFSRGNDLADLSDLSQFNAVIQPSPPQEDLLLELISGSLSFKQRRSEVDAKQVMQRAFAFENPRLSHPGNVDCASCHVAQTVRAWGQKNFPHWDWQREFQTFRFASSTGNLENRSVNPLRTNRLRAFGYFDADPVISQRVINETALILEKLKARAWARR